MSANNTTRAMDNNINENNNKKATTTTGGDDNDENNNNKHNVNDTTTSMSNNIFCDIIAQQQEFQLRQDRQSSQNVSLSSIRARTRQLELERELAEERLWRQRSSERLDYSAQMRPNSSAGHSSEANNSNGSNQNHNHNSNKRNFSLSYAMSSLSAFTAAALPTSEPKQQQQDKLASKQQQRQRLEHQGSMISGAEWSAARSRIHNQNQNDQNNYLAKTSSNQHQQQEHQQQQQVEATLAQDDKTVERGPKKSRGFVHKAIRRGSKMFDSMLLQSAQRETEKLNKQTGCGEDATTIVSSEPNFNLNSSSTPSTSSTAIKGVQFASPRGDSIDANFNESQSTLELSKEPSNTNANRSWRKRKLTLGSLPSDLRRALSFNTTGQHQRQKRKDIRESLDDQPPLYSHKDGASDEPIKNNESYQLGGGSGVKLHNQPQPHHMKRKNSLFSALSSVNPAQLVKSGKEKSAAAALSAAASLTAAAELEKSEQQRARLQASSQNVSLSLCLDHSRTYKLIIYGSGAVGKTSLIQRFLYGHFPASHKPTVEELHSNKYNISEVGEIYLEILDTSGTFEFPAMRRLSIEKGDAFILVFSVLDPASWQEVKNLRRTILEHKGESKMNMGKPPSQQQHSKTTRKYQTDQGDQTLDDGDDDDDQPISSIYAAATKLTSMQRRASCITTSQFPTTPSRKAHQQQPGQSAQGALGARRRLSVCSPSNPNQSQTTPSREQTPSPSQTAPYADMHHQRREQQQSPAMITQSSGSQQQQQPISCSPSSAHYNSQLSRLIQQAPVSDTSGKLAPLESGNSLDEQQEPGVQATPEGQSKDNQSRINNNRINNDDSNNNKTNNNKMQFGNSASEAINKRGVTKRTVSLAPNSMVAARNAANLNSPSRIGGGVENCIADLGIFKRTTTPIVVAANKCDLPQCDWLVDLEEAERLVCQEWGHSFVRCSAREAQNTDRVFKELLRQAQAPPNLSESVIDDNQLRRQSLPVLKNQLSVSQMKGLRNLYNLHQKGAAGTTTAHQQQQQLASGTLETHNQKSSTTSSSLANYQAKLSSSEKQYQNSFVYHKSKSPNQSSSSDSTNSNQQLQQQQQQRQQDFNYANESTATPMRPGFQASSTGSSATQPATARHANQNSAMGARSTSSASDDSQCVIT